MCLQSLESFQAGRINDSKMQKGRKPREGNLLFGGSFTWSDSADSERKSSTCEAETLKEHLAI